MRHHYKPTGTCSQLIEFEIINNALHDVKFTKGCDGNLQGISKLVEGMKIENVITRLEGIQCGSKNTSCPDQLARALKEISPIRQ